MNVNIKLTHENAKIPTYAHETDGCFDLYAADMIYDPAMDIIEYDTGVAIEIPKGHVGLVFQRSSVYKTAHLLRNCVGVIDCGYTASIKCKFLNINRIPELYKIGDRVAQMMITPVDKAEFTVVDELTDTERGEGGYGSTGK